MGFQIKKAAQVVAFFARERGGSIDIIDASKLVYLGDREFMDRFGLTILNDVFYSMEQGPICSNTYDLMKGKGPPEERKIWEHYVTPRQGNVLRSTKAFEDEDLDELSDAELEALYAIAERFAEFQPFELVRWVHETCKEWKNPGKTSTYLPFADVFKALCKENNKELERRLVGLRKLSFEVEKAK
ncbi:MAG TPA: Panacea domain-containing protein [Rhizomicrobium sp.]